MNDTQAVDRALIALQQTLSDLSTISDSDLQALRPHCSIGRWKKLQTLESAGHNSNCIYFLLQGLVRFYYITSDGKEHNKSFAREMQFAGGLQSSLKPYPNRFFIEALEPTTALIIPQSTLQTLYRQSITWANIGRLYMEGVAVRKSNREGEFLLDSAETRYQNFMADYPELVKRLPLYHIASFLGITDVALSRIRGRLNSG